MSTVGARAASSSLECINPCAPEPTLASARARRPRPSPTAPHYDEDDTDARPPQPALVSAGANRLLSAPVGSHQKANDLNLTALAISSAAHTLAHITLAAPATAGPAADQSETDAERENETKTSPNQQSQPAEATQASRQKISCAARSPLIFARNRPSLGPHLSCRVCALAAAASR